MWTNRKGEQVLEVIFLYDDEGYDDVDDVDDDEKEDNINKYTLEEKDIFDKNGGKIPF